MSPATYQTIELSKGKHISPEEGACVMELASMLAGEPFSDHPRCACPVIGSFLRAYNDSVDDGRRQDLYAYASQMVGTRSGRGAARPRTTPGRLGARAAARRWARRLLPGRLRGVGLPAGRAMDAVGTRAVHAIARHTDAATARPRPARRTALARYRVGGAAFGSPVAPTPIPPAVAWS